MGFARFATLHLEPWCVSLSMCADFHFIGVGFLFPCVWGLLGPSRLRCGAKNIKIGSMIQELKLMQFESEI